MDRRTSNDLPEPVFGNDEVSPILSYIAFRPEEDRRIVTIGQEHGDNMTHIKLRGLPDGNFFDHASAGPSLLLVQTGLTARFARAVNRSEASSAISVC